MIPSKVTWPRNGALITRLTTVPIVWIEIPRKALTQFLVLGLFEIQLLTVSQMCLAVEDLGLTLMEGEEVEMTLTWVRIGGLITIQDQVIVTSVFDIAHNIPSRGLPINGGVFETIVPIANAHKILQMQRPIVLLHALSPLEEEGSKGLLIPIEKVLKVC